MISLAHVLGLSFICYALGWTVLFKDQPFRPGFFWAGCFLVALLLPWSVYYFCPGEIRHKLFTRKRTHAYTRTRVLACRNARYVVSHSLELLFIFLPTLVCKTQYILYVLCMACEGGCIYKGESERRRQVKIRRKLRVRGAQTSHIREDEFDAEKEFELLEEYSNELQQFSYYKTVMDLISPEERAKKRKKKRDSQRDSDRKESGGAGMDVEMGDKKSVRLSSMNNGNVAGGKVSFVAS